MDVGEAHALQARQFGDAARHEVVLADASAALLDNDHVRRAYLGI